jgi:hypothetical protein
MKRLPPFLTTFLPLSLPTYLPTYLPTLFAISNAAILRAKLFLFFNLKKKIMGGNGIDS